jgi:cell division protein FtsQ
MINKIINSLVILILIVSAFSFIHLFKKKSNSNFSNLIIDVDSAFLDNDFIKTFLSNQISSDSLSVNFNDLENKFESISYVEDVVIYKDLIGNLNIVIEQYIPIARIVSGKLSNNYINNEGHVFPISSRYSKRVLLLHMNEEFSTDKEFTSSKFGKDLLEMINFINKDEFFSKIISEIEIVSNKNIVIHPQFSKQKIIFGYPDNLDEKFEKINIFYKKIVPAKGWNTYRTVNVKFKNQIICDKS